MIFKPGQKVTLKRRDDWAHVSDHSYKPVAGPKFGEIVTVDLYPYDRRPEYCAFEEYPHVANGGRYAFYENDFEPLVSDEVLREELETVKEPFTI